MILKDNEGKVDTRTALWVSFWLYILQAGEPDLLDALVKLVGRLLA